MRDVAHDASYRVFGGHRERKDRDFLWVIQREKNVKTGSSGPHLYVYPNIGSAPPGVACCIQIGGSYY